MLLSAYDYDIVSADNENADFFSRFPVTAVDIANLSKIDKVQGRYSCGFFFFFYEEVKIKRVCLINRY